MMADLMATRPQLTPTAAIKQLVTDWNDTILHRLRGKWKAQQATLLADARERCRAQSTTAPARAGGAGLSRSIANLTAFNAFDRTKRSHAMQLIEAMANHPARRAAKALHDSPAMCAARAFNDSAVMRAARAYNDLPSVRLMREWEQYSTLGMLNRLKRDGFL
jgi:hypothetical protein